MMNNAKGQIFKEKVFEKLKEINPQANSVFGVMNVHQMIEHLADFFEISYQNPMCKILTPEEQIPAYKAFLMSEKQFRDNTKAPVEILGETPNPLRTENFDDAIEHLKKSVNHFIDVFESGEIKQSSHPVFGMLNFDEWLVLQEKHVRHHFRQFGIQF